MRFFTEELPTGKKTTIKAGDILCWHREKGVLTIFRPSSRVLDAYPCTYIIWPNGERERYADFIRNEHEFAGFVNIFAEIHGLGICIKKEEFVIRATFQ
jgi:hypothetical protein